MSSFLNLSKFDLIAFDLDNTLCRYNLSYLFSSHFKFMCEYLNAKKCYHLPVTLSERHIDFISRGLFIDSEKGNLLKLDHKGDIIQASHGTRPMSSQDIERTYGPKRKWAATDSFVSSNGKLWKGNFHERAKCFMDFTDVTANLVYGLAVDEKEGDVWSDILEALIAMYDPSSWFSRDFKENTAHYLHKTSAQVLDWLKQLKEVCYLGLITSNERSAANSNANFALGPHFEDFFHFQIYDARKPTFFTGNRPFKDIHGVPTEFSLRGQYTEGNCRGIEETLARQLCQRPHLLYLGDSPVHDYISPDIDTVAIVEEGKAEGLFPGPHSSAPFLKSNFWGSFFYHNSAPTLFGSVVFNSKYCAPDLDFLASQPIDSNLIPFWTKSNDI